MQWVLDKIALNLKDDGEADGYAAVFLAVLAAGLGVDFFVSLVFSFELNSCLTLTVIAAAPTLYNSAP